MKQKIDLLEDLKVDFPENLENLQLPAPELVTYYNDLDNRCIWIDNSIDEGMLEVSKLIINFNRFDEDHEIPVENRRPIKIFVFSYGGDCRVCLHLCDLMKLSKTPVYTYNMGVAMSAGLLIYLAGSKRFSLPSATALIHSGSGGTGGTYEQTKAQMKDYENLVKIMKNHILSQTSIDEKTYNKHKTEEWYIYTDEQVKLGITHEVINDISSLL